MLDGIGDLPCKIFNGKTPLEAAETPNLDFLSKKGELAVGEQIEFIRIIIIITTVLVFLILFFSYSKYVFLEDRLEIRNIFGIKLPFIIVAGPRFSKYFAIP